MSQELYDYGPFAAGDVVEIFGLPNHGRRFNGRQTVILAPLGIIHGRPQYVIDVPEAKDFPGQKISIDPQYLRRKRPPTTGEDMIRALFDILPVERRKPATAWQAQYDTAQALMAMGVRVRPGKWMVEVGHE